MAETSSGSDCLQIAITTALHGRIIILQIGMQYIRKLVCWLYHCWKSFLKCKGCWLYYYAAVSYQMFIKMWRLIILLCYSFLSNVHYDVKVVDYIIMLQFPIKCCQFWNRSVINIYVWTTLKEFSKSIFY